MCFNDGEYQRYRNHVYDIFRLGAVRKGESHGRCPLVMFLVHPGVQFRVMH